MRSSETCKNELKEVIEPASMVYKYFKEDTLAGTMKGIDQIVSMVVNLKMGKDDCYRLHVNWSRIKAI